MRNLYYYDSVHHHHHHRRQQQQNQAHTLTTKSVEKYGVLKQRKCEDSKSHGSANIFSVKRKHLADRKANKINNSGNVNTEINHTISNGAVRPQPIHSDEQSSSSGTNNNTSTNSDEQKKPSEKLNQSTKCAKMTDENGMFRNGSVNGVARTDLNYSSGTAATATASTTTTVAAATTTTTTTTSSSPTTGSLNANSINDNGSTTATRNNCNNDAESRSPIDATNGNSTDATNNSPNPTNTSGNSANGGNNNSNAGHASNGNACGTKKQQPNNNSDHSNNNNNNNGNPAQFGRLQFFKDGKFILELARSKDGERGGWVSVPRKTYWPPAALLQNNLNNHKNESSTSLSFSDDNSSVQSSPWQRDHCWKQSTPRKNISKELNLYYYRPVPIVLGEPSRITSKRIRRRPHDKKYQANCIEYAKRDTQQLKRIDTKGECKNGDAETDPVKNDFDEKSKANATDQVDGSNGDVKSTVQIEDEDEKMESKSDDDESKNDVSMIDDSAKSENNSNEERPEAPSTNGRRKRLVRTKLNKVIEKLITKVSEQPSNQVPTQTGPGFHFSNSTRSNDLYYHQQHVSPRKRILREFEKVSLEETSNLATQKRSRSKSNASSDFAMNHSKSGTYATGVTQHISTISTAHSTKNECNRIANGNQSPHKNANSMDSFTSEKSFKSAKASTSSANNQTNAPANEQPPPQQAASRQISSYSIMSLLGHNNTNSNNDSKTDHSNAKDKSTNDPRRSPKSPSSYSSTSRSSTLTSKKKSPTNSIHSPVNYRNAQSPVSSPSSGFHPYLSSSRASPMSSGTLSPTDFYRHRSMYRTTGSPTTSNLSSHAYLNGSPIGYQYSPSAYNSSMQTSPPQSTHNLSSAYNISSLLPHTYEDATSVSRSNNSISHSYSPNSKPRTSDWSPARTSSSATTSSSGSTTISQSHSSSGTNSISSTTIPKKTASIRQKYGSLSPNNVLSGGNSERSASPPKNDSNPTPKSLNDYSMEMKSKRSRSPTDSDKKQQQQQQQQQLYEKDIARYNAELAAAHQQTLMASALHSQRQNPFYGVYPTGGAAQPLMNTPAAYLNPLYYQAMAYENALKNPIPQWMHYPAGALFGPEKNALQQLRKSVENASPRQDRGEYDAHRMLMSPYATGASTSPTSSLPSSGNPSSSSAGAQAWANDAYLLNNSIRSSAFSSGASSHPSAFQRQSQQFNDSEPISLIKDEPSSDVPLNLSKH